MATENQNKYIAVQYKLYTSGTDGKPELIEETAEGDPFIFVSALGMTLDAFEAQIVPLMVGDNFDFTTNFTSVAATLNNIGPGLHAAGPTKNFADFSAFSRSVLSRSIEALFDALTVSSLDSISAFLFSSASLSSSS